jgi:type IV pilus assembly protein PilX
MTAHTGQHGMVLVVTLIMLLMMSLLGLSAIRVTTLEERMAGNWRDQQLSLQAAEAALRGAERQLAPLQAPPNPRDFPNGCGAGEDCLVFDGRESTRRPTEEGVMSADPTQRAEWEALARAYEPEISGIPAQPRFLIEHRGYIRDHLVSGFGANQETGRDQYRITARGSGQTTVSRSVLQTHFIKRYN